MLGIAVKKNSTKKTGENTFEVTDQAIVDDAISFNIRDWCQMHLIDPTNSTALIAHFESHINARKLEEYKKCYNQIEKLHNYFIKKAKDNISCLEKLYGKRIEYEATRLFDGAKRITELYSGADPYREPLDEIYSELQTISEKIDLK